MVKNSKSNTSSVLESSQLDLNSQVNKTSKANSETQQPQDLERIYQARQQFLVSSLMMSWQLFVAFLGPIILGVYLDDHYRTKPFLTISGFVLGIILSGLIVYKNVKMAKNKIN